MATTEEFASAQQSWQRARDYFRSAYELAEKILAALKRHQVSPAADHFVAIRRQLKLVQEQKPDEIASRINNALLGLPLEATSKKARGPGNQPSRNGTATAAPPASLQQTLGTISESFVEVSIILDEHFIQTIPSECPDDTMTEIRNLWLIMYNARTNLLELQQQLYPD